MLFRYRLAWADGEDAGEAAYVACIQPGEAILASDGGKLRRLRVLDLVDVPEKNSPYDGLVRVEAA